MTVGVDKVLDVIPALFNFHLPDFLWCQLLYILCKSKNLYNFPAGIWYLEAWGRVVPTPGGICPAHEQEPNPPYPLRELVEIKVLNTCPVFEGVYPAFCFWYRMRNYAEKKPFANSWHSLKPFILLGF